MTLFDMYLIGLAIGFIIGTITIFGFRWARSMPRRLREALGEKP